MIKLITKQQIGRFVTLSENISDLDIDMFIRDAQEFDTISVFPIALINAIEAKVLAKIQQWNKNRSYGVDDLVLFETYYAALASNTDSQPPSSDWQANELMNFYAEYLLPFIAYSFYYRFIAYHGVKITQAGLKQLVDDTSINVSDKMRGEMLGDIKSKLNVWTGKISKKLNDVYYTFDGVQYLPEIGKHTHLRPQIKVYALGARNYNDRRVNDRCCPPYNNYEPL
jgi:hypothetical protein